MTADGHRALTRQPADTALGCAFGRVAPYSKMVSDLHRCLSVEDAISGCKRVHGHANPLRKNLKIPRGCFMRTTRVSYFESNASRFRRTSHWFLAGVLLCCLTPIVRAQDPVSTGSSGSTTSRPDASAKKLSAESDAADTGDVQAGTDQKSQDSWLNRWLRMVDETRTEQPHYVAPLVTTHVLLVQQYRFDSSWQTNSNGSSTDNYGNGHGLEIIPNSRFEVQVAQPPYIVNSATPSGAGDTSLFVKFRAASAPEGNGAYFVGLFLGASFPTGSAPNGAGHSVLSPTLALAKGRGRFDVQNTFGGNLPTGGVVRLGRSFVWNTAFQYNIKGKIWPMIEQNSNFFADGPDIGKKETFLTPGVVFGNFQIAERLHLGIGAGVQIAATQFHTYNHRWVWTVRLPF